MIICLFQPKILKVKRKKFSDFSYKINNFWGVLISVTRKKSPNVYKSCQKMISLEKLKILTPLQKLPKNVGDLGKLIAAKGCKKLTKVQ